MTEEIEVNNFGKPAVVVDGSTSTWKPEDPLDIDSFMSGADWSGLIRDLLSKGRGLVLFVFPIPKDPQLYEKFPEPVLPEGFDGFLDWTDGVFKAPVSPLKFNPKVHAYAITHAEPASLVIGVIGPVSYLYKWAEAWLRNISKEPRFRSWILDAVWFTHADILYIESGEPIPGVPETEDDPLPKEIDIENDDLVANIMYKGDVPLSQAEEDDLHNTIQE